MVLTSLDEFETLILTLQELGVYVNPNNVPKVMYDLEKELKLRGLYISDCSIAMEIPKAIGRTGYLFIKRARKVVKRYDLLRVS